MIRRPPRSTPLYSSAASDVYKRQDVVGVRARAPHPRLVKEATRIVNLLPKMKPGMQLGKAVVVPYSLPIIFQVRSQSNKNEAYEKSKSKFLKNGWNNN